MPLARGARGVGAQAGGPGVPCRRREAGLGAVSMHAARAALRMEGKGGHAVACSRREQARRPRCTPRRAGSGPRGRAAEPGGRRPAPGGDADTVRACEEGRRASRLPARVTRT